MGPPAGAGPSTATEIQYLLSRAWLVGRAVRWLVAGRMAPGDAELPRLLAALPAC